MADFVDRVGAAVVTGGSGGLGAAVAAMLAARGSDVAITYRANADAARDVVKEVEAASRRGRATRLLRCATAMAKSIDKPSMTRMVIRVGIRAAPTMGR